ALTTTDRLGNTVTRTYNSRNQIVTETRTGSNKDSAPASHTARNIYGPAGRLFYSIGAEGRVTAYTFDSKEQLTEAITYTGKAYD
ncbi:hypothetical protein, partial [Klebsiella variicola]